MCMCFSPIVIFDTCSSAMLLSTPVLFLTSTLVYLKGVWSLYCEWGCLCTVTCEIEALSLPCLPRRWQGTQTNLPWSMRPQGRWGHVQVRNKFRTKCQHPHWDGNKTQSPTLLLDVLLLKQTAFPHFFYSRFGVSGSYRSDVMLWLTGGWHKAGLRARWWPCTWKASLYLWLCGWVSLWSASRLPSSTITFDSTHCCTVSVCLVLGPWCLGLSWLKVGQRCC